MQLTKQQVNNFNTFGYLHMPALFNEAETARIIEEFELSIQTKAAATSMTVVNGPCSADQ